MKSKKETSFLKTKEVNGAKWRKWYVIDASDKKLGRLSTKIASILRGKHKPQFTAHIDSGDFVIVINAKNIVLTGSKQSQKTYYWHTGYPGGIKQVKAAQLLKDKPCDVIYRSVKGMMPKNALNRHSIRKLKIYENNKHPHTNQNPQTLTI